MNKKIKDGVYLALVVLLTPFFFLKGVQFFLNKYDGNWAYVIEQLGLGLIAIFLSVSWLKGRKTFRLGWLNAAVIILLIYVTHTYSFNRSIFDEWFNVISPLHAIHFQKVAPEKTSFYQTRERYAWAPFTAFYEIVGFDKPYSNRLLDGYGILFMVAASLAGAWLAGTISGSKVAALIAGLLIGISPNSISSLPWPSSVQGDSLGVILVALMVGAWIIARQKKDSKGIIIALLFLAAALKGGGSVRTITSGGLLIATDVILFSKDFKKQWLWQWLGVIAIEVFYFLMTSSVQMPPRTQAVPLVVRVAQIMELTTKSFIPPTILAKLIGYLVGVSTKVSWLITLGAAIFIVGWGLTVWCFLVRRGRIFSWAWVWFFLTIFFVPWFAEGYGSTLASINDRSAFNLTDLAGFKYSYLPLVGLHVVVGIFLAKLILQKKKLFLYLTLALLAFRAWEFMFLDHKWAVEIGSPNQKWQNMLFPMLYPGKLSPQHPKYLVLADGRNNPIYWQSFSVEHGMYFDGSVIFSNSAEEFFKKQFSQKTIEPQDVYALGWDSGKQQMLDLTPIFRRWLENPNSVLWQETVFKNWSSKNYTKEGLIVPTIVKFGDIVRRQESELISPTLAFSLPGSGPIEVRLNLYIENLIASRNSSVSVGLLCNTDHGKKKAKELIGWQKTAQDQINESKVKIPLYGRAGYVSAIGKTKCGGVTLAKIVITGSPEIRFKINILELTFPYPKI